MKLVGLTVVNFMPYKGTQKIVFPRSEQRNVMIVLADNMRGKTSLLNALRWGFYGVALGRHLIEVPVHLLHNADAAMEGDWTFEVHIQFEADGHRYDLRRRATKRQLVATPTRPDDFEIAVGLQRDGVAISGYQIETEINKFIPEKVSRFFLFDGELLQEYEALLIEGSEQGQHIKEAIEEVLGVPALINGRDEAATLLKRAQKQQSRDLAHVQGLERQAQQQTALQQRQELYERDLAALREKQQRTKAEREKLGDELEATDKIHQAKAKLDAAEARRKQIVLAQKQRREMRMEAIAQVWKGLLQARLRAKQADLLQEQQKLTAQIGDRRALETKVEQLERLLKTEACPTCGQAMESDKRAAAGQQLGDLQGQLQAFSVDQASLTAVSAKLAALNGLVGVAVGERISDADAELRKMDVELTKLENEIEKLNEQLRGFDTAEIARKRALHSQLLKQEGALDKDISDRQSDAEKIKKELAAIAKVIEGMPAARASRSTAIVKVCTALEKAFSESVEMLRDDLRKQVEARATEAFKAMITQKAYRGLQINSNYGLTIIDERGKPVSIRSAGAEQIVALSLIDGLSRTGRAVGPVVMDTPFGRLDPKHRDNILRYLPKNTSQVILLVHGGEIRKPDDLAPIASRIGAEYEITERSPRHSVLEKVA